jgi:hypothetical protein
MDDDVMLPASHDDRMSALDESTRQALESLRVQLHRSHDSVATDVAYLHDMMGSTYAAAAGALVAAHLDLSRAIRQSVAGADDDDDDDEDSFMSPAGGGGGAVAAESGNSLLQHGRVQRR